MEAHNHQKKLAVINDISGFGRCSIAVALPIISHMKVQCCPLPTSIFSNHTGFDSFFFDDYTEKMEPYMEEWKKLGLKFEGITSGFLGSLRQIEIVKEFIERFRTHRTKVIIDPVMGDNGKPYPTYTREMCNAMKELVFYADILTPNLTECCILTDTPYQANGWKKEELFAMVEKLANYGAQKIVVSGVDMGQFIGNVIYEVGKQPKILRSKRVGHERSGTGDIFSAIIAADCVNGVEFEKSVRKAAGFVKECILATEAFDIPKTDGVCFEEVLHRLS
jgi:pyridoxine kinase